MVSQLAFAQMPEASLPAPVSSDTLAKLRDALRKAQDSVLAGPVDKPVSEADIRKALTDAVTAWATILKG